MTVEKKISQLIAFLKMDYLMSNESERIMNPVRDDSKYNLLCECLSNCYSLSEQYEGKLNGVSPDFPCSCHTISLILPTENDEIIMGKIKGKLANAINSADEVSIYTDIGGNTYICFCFENVYSPREV